MNKYNLQEQIKRYNYLVGEICSLEAVSRGYDRHKVQTYTQELEITLNDIQSYKLDIHYQSTTDYTPYFRRKIKEVT
jgi:hypothetical protein